MIEYTLVERIKVLGLSEDRANAVRKLKYESIWLDDSVIESKGFREEIIEVDKIVGICNRIDAADDWIDLLGLLHKMRNFSDYEKYHEQQFDLILLEPEKYDIPIPLLITHNGQLYIKGDGKHRLTIAKCLGGKKAKVYIGY